MLRSTVTTQLPQWFVKLQKDFSIDFGKSFCFIGSVHTSSLYLSHFLKTHRSVQTVNLEQSGTIPLPCMLQDLLLTSFLGQSCVYVIKTHFDLLSDKEVEKIVSFLTSYRGPHSVIYFISPDKLRAVTKKTVEGAVVIPDEVPTGHLCDLLLHSTVSPVLVTSFSKELARNETVSIQIFFSLQMYSSVLSKAVVGDFVSVYFPFFISQPHYLFELSRKLFSKDKTFFKDWMLLWPKFQPVFWTSFWTDLFNRAALYCLYRKELQSHDMQVVAKGLPFSFLKKEWSLYEPAFLVSYAKAFYEYDVALKSEAVQRPLDFLFIDFFQKKAK